jgi:peptide deformylase
LILPIYTFDHAVLRQETSQIERATMVAQDTSDVKKLIANMIATMRNADGLGLAANQVGKSVALTVIDLTHIENIEERDALHTPDGALVLINPVLVGTHGESVFEEGCLSLPGIREEIVRPEQIGVKFLDRNLKEVELEADKLLARVIQHEIDHLHGKYFIDYLSPFKLSLLKVKLSRMVRGEVETEYPLAPSSSTVQSGHPSKPKGKMKRLPGM